MAWPQSFVINDAGGIPQTWNRSSAVKDYSIYVNDTARAAGIEATMEFRATPKKPLKKVPGSTVTIASGSWNVKLSSRVVATEIEPVTVSFTVGLSHSLSTTVVIARTRIRELYNVLLDISNADAEMDMISAFRTQ